MIQGLPAVLGKEDIEQHFEWVILTKQYIEFLVPFLFLLTYNLGGL